MRNDLTDYLAPARREPAGDSGARSAREATRARDMSNPGAPNRDAPDSGGSRNDDARPRFTLAQTADRPERAREAARSGASAGAGAAQEDAARARDARSGTSPAALMQGRGETVEGSGKSLSPDSLAAILNALAGEAEPGGSTDGKAEKGIIAEAGEAADGTPSGIQTVLAAQAERVAQADGEAEEDTDAGDADVAGDEGEAIAVAEAGGARTEAEAQEVGQRLLAAISGAAPDDVQDDASEEGQSDTGEGEESQQATAAVPAQLTGADEALQPARRDGGPVAASPVTGDAPRAPQGNAAATSATAQITATGDAAAAGSNPDAKGQGGGQGEGQGEGEAAAEAAQAEQTRRSGRVAGDENRSGVALEALRRALGAEAGGDRAALAPGDAAQAASRTGEQMARMMQVGAEGSPMQIQGASQGAAQAAAEASTTANGQANAAGQAGTAATQTNGSVLINTPLSAVPVTLGMKAMGGASRFDIRLDPAELGRIAVSLDIDDEGTVKARLVVDRVETLQLLQRDARTLERAFEQAGLKPSEDGIDLSLRDDGDRHAGRDEGGAEEDRGRGPGDGDGRDGDKSEKGLAAAEIRALARETLLARQALRRALGGVDLSI